MMAKAIGPQNRSGRLGNMPSTVDDGRSGRWAEAGGRGLDGGLLDDQAAVRSSFDLGNQDDRVLRDHADQREDAQNGDEAERPAEQEQRRATTRSCRAAGSLTTRTRRSEVTQLHHQQRQHDEDHHRHDGNDTEACDFRLSSTVPPAAMGSSRRKLLATAASGRDDVSGGTPGRTSASTVRVGTRSRRQTSGCSCSKQKVAN